MKRKGLPNGRPSIATSNARDLVTRHTSMAMPAMVMVVVMPAMVVVMPPVMVVMMMPPVMVVVPPMMVMMMPPVMMMMPPVMVVMAMMVVMVAVSRLVNRAIDLDSDGAARNRGRLQGQGRQPQRQETAKHPKNVLPHRRLLVAPLIRVRGKPIELKSPRRRM